MAVLEVAQAEEVKGEGGAAENEGGEGEKEENSSGESSSGDEEVSDLEEEDLNGIQNEDEGFNLEDYLKFKAQLEEEEKNKLEDEGHHS